MKNNFGFMDETGVLSPQADQRFFALGLLKLVNTAPLYEQLQILKNRTESKIIENARRNNNQLPRKSFEFKFSSITDSSHIFYYDLIDLFFKFPDLSFCCLVFDKKNPNIDIIKYFPNLWDAYISYSKMLVENNINNNETICIIADYLCKPKSSTKYYETEMNKIKGVYNACMLESHASLFIQLVDVLIGSIVFDYKIFREEKIKSDKFKQRVCEFLKKKLKKTTLEGNFTVHIPNYFSVWEFKQNKK